MKKKSRVATSIIQYTLLGEPEIQNVYEVIYKLEKREQMNVKSYFTRQNNKKWKQEPRKRKSRRIRVRK